MSEKVNMSLDDIIKTQKKTTKKKPQRGHVKGKQNTYKARKPKPEPKHKLLISNLSSEVNNDQIRELFSEIGELERCGIHWDKLGRSKGTAQVAYTSEDNAKKAIEQLNGKELSGQSIKVDYK